MVSFLGTVVMPVQHTYLRHMEILQHRKRVIVACCVLHNIALDRNQYLYEDEMEDLSDDDNDDSPDRRHQVSEIPTDEANSPRPRDSPLAEAA
ncbi:hypothetical protein OUZ56_029650 [Daphnia magna]|uniref:DDE Tnp4 domain-containing protein n=1 Tax=Daphnia magna TaxID=35525 RepID=A0ABR0B7F3_9CRUS|nr:hypothetical protein OUZ56_029650 [Daphnia magna]